MFDAVAEAYDAHRSGYPREIVTAAVDLARLTPGSRVVEVGSVRPTQLVALVTASTPN